ncbi:hypothetical protein DOTSEDRAFT_38223 [Dothistroma septosporum NZE10]|uniref:Uncharacterized protein n=1 Tax=Dothistroma septosporum (strain NZE10 / CBS 128990) TaxID=675120 RepID=N1PG33_DOTSN|nr:hypothetical protein DOTSEDRAFT_38223 [Dothistroma septosporum NZE10]
MTLTVRTIIESPRRCQYIIRRRTCSKLHQQFPRHNWHNTTTTTLSQLTNPHTRSTQRLFASTSYLPDRPAPQAIGCNSPLTSLHAYLPPTFTFQLSGPRAKTMSPLKPWAEMALSERFLNPSANPNPQVRPQLDLTGGCIFFSVWALGYLILYLYRRGSWYKRRVQVLEEGLEKGTDWADLGPNLKGREILLRKFGEHQRWNRRMFEENEKWNGMMVEHFGSGERLGEGKW